jgi:DNA-binding IclR family transcriptional regulator
MGKTSQNMIQSDENLLDIVEILGENETMGVTELANEVGMSKGNVHAHLSSLNERGFVLNEDGSYRLGLEFFRYGIKSRNSYKAYEPLKMKVTQLADNTGERVWAFVEENGMAYYLCGAKGEHPVQPPVQVGERTHMHQIAGGKALLACFSEERVQEIIDQHGLPAETQKTITEPADLFEELAEVRDRGYAFNKEESLKGLHAVAAPIQPPDVPFTAALSISGPANRLTDEVLDSKLTELLLGAVNELEINLSYA